MFILILVVFDLLDSSRNWRSSFIRIQLLSACIWSDLINSIKFNVYLAVMMVCIFVCLRSYGNEILAFLCVIGHNMAKQSNIVGTYYFFHANHNYPSCNEDSAIVSINMQFRSKYPI